MKANNILKIAIGFLIVLAFANIAVADEAQDRELAFRAYVAFGKSIDERAVLKYADGSIDEFFIVRNRFEFEKAVEKVKARLGSKTEFYSSVSFRDPWTGRTISGFDVYNSMERKARELEAKEPGTVEHYYSQFGEQRSKISLVITVTKDGQNFIATDTNLPLVSVVRKSDGVVVKSEQKAAVSYNDLLRDNYEVRFGTLPGYVTTPASCNIPAGTSTDSSFTCAKDYVKKKVERQITANRVGADKIEVILPEELLAEFGTGFDVSIIGNYKVLEGTNSYDPTAISTNKIDATTYKVELTYTMAADKTYKLKIGSNVIIPIFTKGQIKSDNYNSRISLTKGHIFAVTSDYTLSNDQKIDVPKDKAIELNVVLKKLNVMTETGTAATPYNLKEIVIPNEINRYNENIRWNWEIVYTATSGVASPAEIKIDKNRMSFTPDKFGKYNVTLQLKHHYDSYAWFDEADYNLFTTPITWTFEVIDGSPEQITAKEQEIISGIDEATRTFELAKSYYKKRDKQNALNTLNPVYQKITELKTKINTDLANHVRKDKYLAQVDNTLVTPAATIAGLLQKADALKKEIDDNLVQKNVGNIITLANAITFVPDSANIPAGWAGGKIEVKKPIGVTTTAPLAGFTAQADVDAIITALVKKYTVRKMTLDGPVISEEKGIDFKYNAANSITPDIKQITLELFYKDPASNEETKVLTKDWKFGELERIVPNRDYKIKTQDRILVGQQAEFSVLKDDGSEVTGATGFIWKVSRGGTVVPGIDTTSAKLRWKPTVNGDYLVEVSFDLESKKVTNVRQKVIVTELANLNVEQLKSAYSASVNDLNAARAYITSVESNTADVAVLDEHLRKLIDADLIFGQIKSHASKATILTELGIVESPDTTQNTLDWFIKEAKTTLPTKITEIKNKKDVAEGRALPLLELVITPERPRINEEVEFKVVKKGGEELSNEVLSKIKKFSWTITATGKSGLPTGVPTGNVNKYKFTSNDAATYTVQVNLETSQINIKVEPISDKQFTAVDLKVGSTSGSDLTKAYSEANAKLELAKSHLEGSNKRQDTQANLEEDKKLLDDAKNTYDKILTAFSSRAPTGGAWITLESDVTAKKAEAERLLALIESKKGLLTAAEARRITEIRVEAKSADDSSSDTKINAADVFPISSAVYVTAVGYEGSNIVDFKDFKWEIKEGNDNKALVTGTDTTTLESVAVDKNKVSGKVKADAPDGTKIIIRATKTSAPLVQGETALTLVSNFDRIGLVNKEIRFVTRTSADATDAVDKGDANTKYIKLDNNWFEYKNFTKEYVTELYNKFVIERRQSAQQFQELLNK